MPRRRTALPALALCLAVALGACGGEEPAATAPATGTDSPAGGGSSGDGSNSASIELERVDDAFTPSGARVEVPVGEPVTLAITSDEAGELHVHSTPEQEIAYDAGTSEHQVTIDRPGVVEVESHEPHLVVLQLEAR